MIYNKSVAVLGSTGSIGTQALDVCENLGIKVSALSANRSTKLLSEQARRFNAKCVCIADESLYSDLKIRLSDTNIKILCGKKGLSEMASLSYCDTVLNSVVGIAGLNATFSAINARKTLALANKESLVTGGALVTKMARENGVSILPVDSEHSAIFQCLQGRASNKISKILLTASGGPFFGKDRAYLENVSVKEALCHPNWSMGKKITIDSATMMNKGLELIEAVWLFDVPPEDVEIVIHRESILHSAVEFDDYSIIGQMGVPDMKIPIQYALTYPNREKCAVKRLSLTDYKLLSFYKPDYDNFKCLSACKEAISAGGLAPCAANGANEAAVAKFLDGKISFNKIGELVQKSVSNVKNKQEYNIDDVWETDQAAREMVMSET